jgi:histidinol-phosphate aminotransferase
VAVDFRQWCVDGVRELAPYQAGKPIEELQRELGISDIIKLASNENPLGPSPLALAAMRAVLDGIALYPDGNGFALKRALAAHHAIDQDCVTLGSGSDHILELIARVFLGPGRSAVISQYGFSIYNIVAQAAGAELRIAPAHAPDHAEQPYGHDLEAMLRLVDASTRVVFIANPNNPTGNFVTGAELEAFLARVPPETVVVVDEAYTEFVTDARHQEATAFLTRFPNLIVVRTFSKAYGLAGVRVGYALATPQLTDLLNRVRLAFNPNALAQVAAVAALGDRSHIERTVAVNRAGKAQLEAGFRALGLTFIPSQCNFLTVDVQRPAQPVFDALLREGIIVRPVGNYGLPRHLRISVGTEAQNIRLLAALGRVLAA